MCASLSQRRNRISNLESPAWVMHHVMQRVCTMYSCISCIGFVHEMIMRPCAALCVALFADSATQAPRKAAQQGGTWGHARRVQLPRAPHQAAHRARQGAAHGTLRGTVCGTVRAKRRAPRPASAAHSVAHDACIPLARRCSPQAPRKHPFSHSCERGAHSVLHSVRYKEGTAWFQSEAMKNSEPQNF